MAYTHYIKGNKFLNLEKGFKAITSDFDKYMFLKNCIDFVDDVHTFSVYDTDNPITFKGKEWVSISVRYHIYDGGKYRITLNDKSWSICDLLECTVTYDELIELAKQMLLIKY